MDAFGPFFVYNGIPEEDGVFRQALDSPFCKLPKDKIVIIDEVRDEDRISHPIRHTADQVKSFYQELANPESPLYEITNVALVAHIPDYVRIPFYTNKYNNEYIARRERSIHFWAYGLRSRKGSTVLNIQGTEHTHMESELPRLVEYAKRGYFATEPSTFSV